MRGEKATVLIGCGILRREVALLAGKNGWNLEKRFLDQALHIDLELLEHKLKGEMEKHAGREMIVCYGVCHPRMDEMMQSFGAVRTDSQNCIEMLLGPEEFRAETERGAFFLIEGWARRFEEMTLKTFGGNLDVAREIFQSQHTHLLALRTPCSGDYARQAEAASEMIGLPLKWRDVSLSRLEDILMDAICHSRHQT